jgi:S-adenosylmethionine decarboxylase
MSEIIKYEIKDNAEHLTRGKHLILDIWGVNKEKTVCTSTSISSIEEDIIKIITELGSKVINHDSVIFENGSYSSYFLLTESHFSIHTWPEHSYVSIDFYTCCYDTDMDKATQLLLKYFGYIECKVKVLKRGIK